MITLRTDPPLANRDDVWCSELQIKNLTPARRDKLVSLLNLVGFTIRNGTLPTEKGEVIKNGTIYKLDVG